MLGDKWYKGNYFYCATIWMAVPFTKKILGQMGFDRIMSLILDKMSLWQQNLCILGHEERNGAEK